MGLIDADLISFWLLKAPMKKLILWFLPTSECFTNYYIIVNASIHYASKTIQLTIQYTS